MAPSEPVETEITTLTFRLFGNDSARACVRMPRRLVVLALMTIALSASACRTTYSERVSRAHGFASAGNYPGAIREMNRVLGVDSVNELPDKWTAHKPLATLERAVLLQATDDFARSSRDLSGADMQLEYLDLELDTPGNLGKYVYSDSAQIYKATPTEKLALNAFNMLNYLALGELASAAVEARRFGVIRDYLVERDRNARGAFGSYLAGFVFEHLGETDRALRHYNDALADVDDIGSLGQAIVDLSNASAYRGEPLARYLETEAARRYAEQPVEDESAEILVVTSVGRVPYKEPATMPIGLAIGYAGAFITGDLRVLERTAFKVVRYPELHPSPSDLDRVRVHVDGTDVPAPLITNLGDEIVREHEELKPMLIGSALTRMIARALAAEGARQAGRQASYGFGLLAALATEAALVGLDKPDTRSWTFLPERIRIARRRVPPGEHRVVVSLDGSASEQREVTFDLPPRTFGVLVVTAPR